MVSATASITPPSPGGPSFSAAPEIPEFLSREFPWRRRLLALRDGDFAGCGLCFVDSRSEARGEDGRPIFLVHGNPTWSFLWRKVMSLLHEADPTLRLVAPDLVGLGFSDKPPRPRIHSVEAHAVSLAELARALDLRGGILVGQDWGGPIAMAVGSREPHRFDGIVGANGTLALPRHPRSKPFHRFSRVPLVSDFVFRVLGFPLWILHRLQNDASTLTGEVGRAYRWPLRKIADRAAPLGLARMVPDADDHPSLPELRRGEAWVESLPAGHVSIVWGRNDPILGRALDRQARRFPDAPVRETDAGHFLQEEVPEVIAEAILEMHRRLCDDKDLDT